MSYFLGVDIGGTFTDFSLLNCENGNVSTYKRLTTTSEPSLGVIYGINDLLIQSNCKIDQIERLVHGTTLVTNATIERKGAVTGMLVTKGFRDVLEIAKEQRYEMSDLRVEFPVPVVPRRLIREVNERIHFDGQIENELSISEVHHLIDELIRNFKVEAISVCFLHSYAYPKHERMIQKLVKSKFPNLFLSISSEVSPFIREYERWTTTTINAYVQPMIDQYLLSIESELSKLGFTGDLLIMTSNGGICRPDIARRFPVKLIESGPVAGALISAYNSIKLNQKNVLSFDMGGTTAKGTIIKDHIPMRSDEFEVAHVFRSRKGSGLPLKIPVVDMIEIGSGGGSIAQVDERGLISVGPQSSGSTPGPACYDQGGQKATLTDANLFLGYLDKDFFLGGKMKLNIEKAAKAINSCIAKPLGLSLNRAAWGIHETINENVARAFRMHSAQRGFDHRTSCMIAFGGSGPVHAIRTAGKLRIPKVIIPAGAGVMSAIGLLTAPISHQTVQTEYVLLEDINVEKFTEKLNSMAKDVTNFVTMAGVSLSEIKLSYCIDMRYLGQGYEIEIILPEKFDLAKSFKNLKSIFSEKYYQVFSTNFGDWPCEIVNWKVEASGPIPSLGKSGYFLQTYTNSDSKKALKGHRKVYNPEKDTYINCPVYDRYALSVGTMLEGPSLIEENESTCVIGFHDKVLVDKSYNLVVEVFI